MKDKISHEELQKNNGEYIVNNTLYEYINNYIKELDKEYNNKIELLNEEIENWQSESHPYIGGCGDPSDLNPKQVRDFVDKELSEKDKISTLFKEVTKEVYCLNKKYRDLIRLLPDENKLELLSKWIDTMDKNDHNQEVQEDILRWAKNIREIKKLI